MKKRTILIVTVFIIFKLFYSVSIYAEETLKNNPKKNQTKISKKKSSTISVYQTEERSIEYYINAKRTKKLFDFDLDIKAFGGGLFNYESYNVKTPLVGTQINAGFDLNMTDSVYIKIKSKTEFRKTFIGAQGTKLMLDQYQEHAHAQFGILDDLGEINFKLKYTWMYRPSWPDLYQPNPLAFNGIPDPKFGLYLPTDRNSYQRISPEFNFILTKLENFELILTPGYLRNIETIDPAFNPAIPTHLTPSSYSALFVIAGVKYEGVKFLDMELTNKIESFTYDTELARDATTGKTNYLKTPNPTYKELNNKSTASVGIKFEKINLEIKPIVSLDFNVDQYRGYYSYTGFEPGIEIKQKINHFQYTVKFYEDIQNYGSNSFDSNLTTDKKRLFKYYTKGSLELKYSLSKNLDIFAEGDMLIKKTNYPPYVPGVNPAKKNYNIDFSFSNFNVYSGVTYKFK